MRFKGLDLNLLVAFEMLLETRSTSRTAERLNLSQPAASAALGRLRTFFGDEILVAHGKRMLPTSYAESLRPHVTACLRSAETLIATTATFDPATSQRRFFVTASDYVIAAVLTPLIRRLAEVAPSISLEFSLPDERANADLDEGQLDLLITPEDFVSTGHPTEFLFDDDHVVVGCAANPLMAGPISADAFAAAGHVGVSIARPRQHSYADERVEATGMRCRYELLVPLVHARPVAGHRQRPDRDDARTPRPVDGRYPADRDPAAARSHPPHPRARAVPQCPRRRWRPALAASTRSASPAPRHL